MIGLLMFKLKWSGDMVFVAVSAPFDPFLFFAEWFALTAGFGFSA